MRDLFLLYSNAANTMSEVGDGLLELSAKDRPNRPLMKAAGQLPEPASRDFIQWLHGEFYRNVPESMLNLKGHG